MKEAFGKLVDIGKRKREKCIWYRNDQDIKSFSKELINETEEFKEALENNDLDAFKDELGDIIWDAVLISLKAEDMGLFTLKEVLENSHKKMKARQRHIYDEPTENLDLIYKMYNEVKAKQKQENKAKPKRFIFDEKGNADKNKKGYADIGKNENRYDKNANNSSKIKAILFDWDGVILDSLPACFKIYKEYEKLLNVDFGIKDKEKDQFEVNWVKHFVRAKVDAGSGQLAEKLKKTYTEMTHSMINSNTISIFPEIRNTIKALHEKFKLGIVSNSYTELIKNKLKKEGLLDYFDFIIDVEHSRPKPDPTMLIAAVKKMDVDPKETIYIGDMDGDIETAKNAGVKSIAVTYGYHSHKRLMPKNPDEIADSPKEILDAVERIISKEG